MSMVRKWLGWVNLAIGGLAAILLLFALVMSFSRTKEFALAEVVPISTSLPKGAFVLPKQAYDAIGDPLLSLNFSPMTMQLPDLRRYLVYYGRNTRPDADPERVLLHFSLTGKKTPVSVNAGERLYLVYDRSQQRGGYIFSPDNNETSLWVEATPKDKEALVEVGMINKRGEVIHEPKSHAEFSLPERELLRLGGATWEIGKWRVDASVLARQRARWYGEDRFIEKHGGKEFSDYFDKQRIDFGEGENFYSVYAGIGDALIWKEDRWRETTLGEESQGFPLLVPKKIEERLMNLELWDVEGKVKISLNLLRSTEAWFPQNIQRNFKFVGARTRSQFVFEVDKERMLLSPQDWLLLTESGWKKLVTSEEIDDYVTRKVTGPLFVFDGVSRKDGRQVLMGTLFNATRTDMRNIEIPVQQGGTPITPVESSGKVEESSDGIESEDSTSALSIRMKEINELRKFHK